MGELEKERRKINQKNYRIRNPEKVRNRGKKYRVANKITLSEDNKRYYEENKKELLKKKKEYVTKNPEKIAAIKKAARKKARQEALSKYGGEDPKCVCCKEDDEKSLCIDHEKGGGNAHRRSIGKLAGYAFYVWLKKNTYPPGFRVLCLNCNASHGLFGYCPHNGKPERAESSISRYLKATKKKVMTAYSGGEPKCDECGVEHIEFLTLDHDGVVHRRDAQRGAGWKTYKWALDNGLPPGFRVLCFRCNFLKWANSARRKS